MWRQIQIYLFIYQGTLVGMKDDRNIQTGCTEASLLSVSEKMKWIMSWWGRGNKTDLLGNIKTISGLPQLSLSPFCGGWIGKEKTGMRNRSAAKPLHLHLVSKAAAELLKSWSKHQWLVTLESSANGQQVGNCITSLNLRYSQTLFSSETAKEIQKAKTKI